MTSPVHDKKTHVVERAPLLLRRRLGFFFPRGTANALGLPVVRETRVVLAIRLVSLLVSGSIRIGASD